MAKILVNPTSLKSSAKQISSVSTLIQKAGESAWRIASGAPSYDGQFGPKVRAIAQAALARAKKQSASTKTLSNSLNKRATAFEAADTAAVKGISRSKLDKPGVLKFVGFVGNIKSLLNKAKTILGLGNLGKNTAENKIPYVISSSINDALITFWLNFSRKLYEEKFSNWWDELTNDEKLKYLNEQLNEMAKDFGMVAPVLVIENIEDPESGDYRGAYYTETHVIHMDKSNFNLDDPWTIIETLAHETRHAFQYHAIQVFEETGRPPSGVSVKTVNEWKEEFENYISPEDDFEEYRNQAIETDARNYASNYTNRILVQEPWKE